MPPIHQDQYWSIENCASSFKIHVFIIFTCTFWKDRNGETIQVRRLNGLTMGWRSIITSHVDPFRCSLNVSFPGRQPPNPPTQVLKCLKRFDAICVRIEIHMMQALEDGSLEEAADQWVDGITHGIGQIGLGSGKFWLERWMPRANEVIQVTWSAAQMLFRCCSSVTLPQCSVMRNASMTGSCKQPGKVGAKSWSWVSLWVVMEKHVNRPTAPGATPDLPKSPFYIFYLFLFPRP